MAKGPRKVIIHLRADALASHDPIAFHAGFRMNCQEFQTSLYSYVHGELGVKEIMAADAHSAECLRCQSLVDWERWFRQLLRHQLWKSAPRALRARIVSRIRRSARVVLLRSGSLPRSRRSRF